MSLPYFPLFPSDFEAKTSHLTLEEDGAYNRILRLMWMTPGCSLPDDDAWIMRRMRVNADTYERVVRVVIDEFCTRENGRLSNAKLARIFDDSNGRHERRVSAGAKGGKAKALKSNKTTSGSATAKLKQPEPEPEPDTLEPNGSNDADGVDPVVRARIEAIWKGGVAYLSGSGVAERQARSLIGKWLRDHGDEALYAALASAKKAMTGDPVPYIEAVFAPEKTNTDVMNDIVARVRARRQGYSE